MRDVNELLALREGTTPGPWKYMAQGGSSTVLAPVLPPRNDRRCEEAYGYRGETFCIAYPFLEGEGKPETRLDFVSFGHADARAIAAVPELFAAIEAQAREIAALTARAEAAEAKAGRTPDYCYDPVEWEYTMPWVNAADVAESALWQCEVARIATLVQGPEKWAIWSKDRDQIHWFDTEADARAALREIGGGNG